MSAPTLKTLAAALAVSAGLAVAAVSTAATADTALTMKSDAARALPPGNERTAIAEANEPLTGNPLIAAGDMKVQAKTGIATAGTDQARKRKRRRGRRYARRRR